MRTLSSVVTGVVTVWVVSGCFDPTADSGNDGLVQGDVRGDGGAASAAGMPDPNDANACLSFALSGELTQPNNTPNGCLCTRRDVVPVGTCPRGVGQSTSATIGPEGGTLTLVGQSGVGVPFTIEIPPTAIATPTLITITETSLSPPGVDWSPVFRIDPVGLQLTTAAKVKVPWSQGPIYGAPTLYWSASSLCTLEPLPGSYSNAGFNQANIGRFGYAMSGYAKAGAATMCR